MYRLIISYKLRVLFRVAKSFEIKAVKIDASKKTVISCFCLIKKK